MADVKDFPGTTRPRVHATDDVAKIIDILSHKNFDGREVAILLAKHDPLLFLDLYSKCKTKVST